PEDPAARAPERGPARSRNSWSLRGRSVGSGSMAITAALRLLALVLTAALSTCHAPRTTTPPTPTAATPPAPGPRVFDPDVVRPDPSSALGRVMLEESPARRLELARAALGTATADERARLAWVGARAAERAGVSEHAIQLFG